MEQRHAQGFSQIKWLGITSSSKAIHKCEYEKADAECVFGHALHVRNAARSPTGAWHPLESDSFQNEID
jgi:hypothetical protein